jgi:hypothetical protein
MSNTSGWGSPREYTVVENAKKEKNGKIGVKKWSFWSKSAKNDPNPEKEGPSNRQNSLAG